MGYDRGGNVSMNTQILSQQDWDINNGDVSFGNGFINRYNISQCNDSSYFKYMNGNVENDDVSGGHGYMNIHTLYQHNGLKPLINLNNSDYI